MQDSSGLLTPQREVRRAAAQVLRYANHAAAAAMTVVIDAAGPAGRAQQHRQAGKPAVRQVHLGAGQHALT